MVHYLWHGLRNSGLGSPLIHDGFFFFKILNRVSESDLQYCLHWRRGYEWKKPSTELWSLPITTRKYGSPYKLKFTRRMAFCPWKKLYPTNISVGRANTVNILGWLKIFTRQKDFVGQKLILRVNFWCEDGKLLHDEENDCRLGNINGVVLIDIRKVTKL